MTTRVGPQEVVGRPAPCLRNSGLLKTLKGCRGFTSDDSPHPSGPSTGTVLLSTMTLNPFIRLRDFARDAEECCRSAAPSSPWPACPRADEDHRTTARTARAAESVNVRRFSRRSGARVLRVPVRKMGIRPLRNVRTLRRPCPRRRRQFPVSREARRRPPGQRKKAGPDDGKLIGSAPRPTQAYGARCH